MSTFSGPTQVIVSGDMSKNITSTPQILYLMSKCSFSFKWAGTSPVGTITLEGSNDFSLNNALGVYNTGNWNPMYFTYGGSLVNSISVGANTGNGIIDVTATGVYAIRIKYNFVSGVGTLNSYFFAKAG